MCKPTTCSDEPYNGTGERDPARDWRVPIKLTLVTPGAGRVAAWRGVVVVVVVVAGQPRRCRGAGDVAAAGRWTLIVVLIKTSAVYLHRTSVFICAPSTHPHRLWSTAPAAAAGGQHGQHDAAARDGVIRAAHRRLVKPILSRVATDRLDRTCADG